MAYLYFISSDGSTTVQLDSEQSITVSQSNQSTKSSIMRGAQKSDGYVEGNRQVSVTGIVTYSKTPSQVANLNPTPAEFVTLMEEQVASHTRFTLYADTSYSNLLRDIDDCVILDWNYVVDRYENAITVAITFEEQFITEAAKKTFLSPQRSEATKDSLGDKTGGNGSKVNKSSVDEGSSLLYKTSVGITELITGGEE